jgi:hypothetical protein
VGEHTTDVHLRQSVVVLAGSVIGLQLPVIVAFQLPLQQSSFRGPSRMVVVGDGASAKLPDTILSAAQRPDGNVPTTSTTALRTCSSECA